MSGPVMLVVLDGFGIGDGGAAEDAAVINPNTANAVRAAVRLLTSLRVDGDKSLTVPVTFRNGGAYITRVRISDTKSVYR